MPVSWNSAPAGDHDLGVALAHAVVGDDVRHDAPAEQDPRQPQRDVQHDLDVDPRVVRHPEPSRRVDGRDVPPRLHLLVGVDRLEQPLEPAVAARRDADADVGDRLARRSDGPIGVDLTGTLIACEASAGGRPALRPERQSSRGRNGRPGRRVSADSRRMPSRVRSKPPPSCSPSASLPPSSNADDDSAYVRRSIDAGARDPLLQGGVRGAQPPSANGLLSASRNAAAAARLRGSCRSSVASSSVTPAAAGAEAGCRATAPLHAAAGAASRDRVEDQLDGAVLRVARVGDDRRARQLGRDGADAEVELRAEGRLELHEPRDAAVASQPHAQQPCRRRAGGAGSERTRQLRRRASAHDTARRAAAAPRAGASRSRRTGSSSRCARGRRPCRRSSPSIRSAPRTRAPQPRPASVHERPGRDARLDPGRRRRRRADGRGRARTPRPSSPPDVVPSASVTVTRPSEPRMAVSVRAAAELHELEGALERLAARRALDGARRELVVAAAAGADTPSGDAAEPRCMPARTCPPMPPAVSPAREREHDGHERDERDVLARRLPARVAASLASAQHRPRIRAIPADCATIGADCCAAACACAR